MNEIGMPGPSHVQHASPGPEVVPLMARAREAAAAAAQHASDEGEVTPLPGPKDPDPVRAWALQIFMERIFYGDEEESGIPSLSIDI